MSQSAAPDKSIRRSLVSTGWICITIPILIQFGLFVTEFQLTKNTERLAEQERHESEANDLTMRANSLLSKGWAALILRGARSVAKQDTTINQNVSEIRSLIEQLKNTPRVGSDSAQATIVSELQLQANNLERTNESITAESKNDEITEHGTLAMFDRIKTLKRDGTNSLRMLDHLSEAAAQQRQELAKSRLETANKRSQIQTFISIALFVDMLAAILVPLIFLIGISRRLKFLIANARKLPTDSLLDRGIKGADEISFLNAVLCDAKETIQKTEARRQLLVDMISHDVRAPLASATLILHTIDSPQKLAEPNERLGRLKNIFKRISVLVSDMLDMDKIEAGKIQLDLQLTDIGEIIESSVEAMIPQASARSMTINRDFSSRTVVVDPVRIGQVLDNLLSNAIKHSPAGSVIKISTQLSNGELHISIADEGQGIDPNQLDKIFERRFQTTEGRAKGGYGLGLFICRQIINLHNGKIRAINLEPRGCQFTIVLPDDQDELEDSCC